MSSDYPQDSEQPFVSHLVELRDRLLRTILVVFLLFFGLAFYANEIYAYLAGPLLKHMPAGSQMIAIEVASPFLAPFKLTLVVSVFLAAPYILYQAWAFVAPGLYGHEKRLVLPLIFFGSLLAYTGIAFVQFFVLDKMFAFIQAVTPSSVAATPDIASYVEAILGLYLAFGVAFQVPIVVVLLARMNMVSIDKLKDFRGYFIVLSFVIAAVLTPPDVVSQLALAVPMCLLYEVGIWAAQLFIKHTGTPEDQEQAAKP